MVLLDHQNSRLGRRRTTEIACGNCRRRQKLPGDLPFLNHQSPIVRSAFISRKTTPMRIYGPNGTTFGTPAAGAKRTSSTGFSLPDTAPAAENRAAAPMRAATSLDALMALQGVEDPTERRRKSVQRGRGALDVLDELKISLLTGSFDSSTVARLRSAAADLKASSGDPGLDSVLSEIELRVEVELAKAGQV
jgi:hypothetical protein